MKLLEQIEAMRARMNELATGEQAIIKTLGEALAAVDQLLLEDVRNVSAAHEARRGAILRELKMLAERMGALHPATGTGHCSIGGHFGNRGNDATRTYSAALQWRW